MIISITNYMRNGMRRARQNSRGRESRRTPMERKSFTLSRESIALLNDLRAARQGSRRRSVSAALDDLPRALEKQRKRDAVEQATPGFYDGIIQEARSEEREWGEF